MQITQHLAANEQDILWPWFKTFPKKFVDRIPTYMWPIGTFTLIYVSFEATTYYDQTEVLAHRF